MCIEKNSLSNAVAFLVGLLICSLILLATDQIFGQIATHRNPESFRIPDIYKRGIVADEDLGYKLIPNLSITTTKITAGEIIYTATYTTDSQGRRIVPNSSGREHLQQFIAFFGCSFTFGEGVNDEDTLPNKVAEQMPEYMVYNYGVPGYGPQLMLAMLQSGDIARTIPQRKGIIVYIFFHDHINRAAGRMSCAIRAGKHFPCYEICDGVLERRGNFDTARPTRLNLMTFLNHSGIVRYFWLDFPPLRSYHYKLTAQIIAESNRLFKSQFDDISFYVLVYPTVPALNKDPALLFAYLKNTEVQIIDCHAFPYDRQKHALHNQYDFHPSPLLHKIMAEILVSKLKVTEKPEL